VSLGNLLAGLSAREMIDDAIDAVFETLLSAFGLGNSDDEADSEFDGEIGERVRFSAAGEGHTQWIENGVPMIASTPMPVTQRLSDWRGRLRQDPSPEDGVGGPTDADAASAELSTAEGALSRLLTEVGEAEAIGTGAEQQDELEQADDEVEAAQDVIVRSLSRLFALFQDEAPEPAFGEPVQFSGLDNASHVLDIGSDGHATIDGRAATSIVSALRTAAGDIADLRSRVGVLDSAIDALDIVAVSMAAGEGGTVDSEKSAAVRAAGEIVGLPDYSAELGAVHAAARDQVDAAWQTLVRSTIPTPWSAAKIAIESTAPVSELIAAPTNKTAGFGQTQGHPQAVEALGRAVQQYEAPGEAEAPEAAKSDPDTFVSGRKAGTLHQGASLTALQGEVWDGSSSMIEAATATMADALVENIANGGNRDPLPELTDEARAAIWRAVQQVGVSIDRRSAEEIYVVLNDRAAVTSAFSTAVRDTGSAELQAAQDRWLALMYQDEYHHAWPQWLDGDPNQTRLYLPRILHNFRPATSEGTGGFHQVFSGLFNAHDWTGPDGESVSVERSRQSWQGYRALYAADPDGWSDVLDDIHELIVSAYNTIFNGLDADARQIYLDEAQREFGELQAAGPSGRQTSSD